MAVAAVEPRHRGRAQTKKGHGQKPKHPSEAKRRAMSRSFPDIQQRERKKGRRHREQVPLWQIAASRNASLAERWCHVHRHQPARNPAAQRRNAARRLAPGSGLSGRPRMLPRKLRQH